MDSKIDQGEVYYASTKMDGMNEGAIKDLAVAVLVQSVKDLRDNNLVTALDAVLWLTGQEAPMWFDALGMEDFDGLAFLASGRARKRIHRRLNDKG